MAATAQLSAQALAAEIETKLAAIKGPLPASDDRRDLFLAIAQGIVDHLVTNHGAFTVSIDHVLPVDDEACVSISGDAS